MRPNPASPLSLCCAAVLTLALAGCGDKAPSDAPPAEGPGTPAIEIPASALPPGVSKEEFAARMKEAMEKHGRKGGPTIPASAWAPLKTSDVELYLKLAPEIRKAGSDMAAIGRIAGEHGLSATQWVIIQSRVTGTAMALTYGTVPEQLKADVEVVKPYKDKILAVIQDR